MKPSVSILLVGSLILATTGLTACGKKDGDTTTNIVEMNAADGTMNDMTVVESATLDQAGAAAADNGAADAGNASNAM
ncbi:hypothetical protein [Rhizorhabdus dicambivorans]|uniref:Circumsporozoite protein n=1 Tax=Rhizorhabdus dicambivorans TaxID=1850238 RepID=A0A2A4FU60_9SPHN|nr:hypothetical protein [Rhizorhabdus dicambivorans]ATE64303.1 hypothetical protein CMV14_07750 [Rhizorhabdus dicambivorans]PCE40931.1 hypothetical protein COO09_18040 [Rhizorhabdus dicambivorans]